MGGRGQETSTVEDFLQVGLWSRPLPLPRVPDGYLGPKPPSRCEWGCPLAPGWVPGSNPRTTIQPTGVRTGTTKIRVSRSIPPPRPHSHLSLKAPRGRALLTSLPRSRPSAEPVPSGWGRGRGSQTGYTRNPTGPLPGPLPPAPRVDASVYLLIKKQGRAHAQKSPPTHLGPPHPKPHPCLWSTPMPKLCPHSQGFFFFLF